ATPVTLYVDGARGANTLGCSSPGSGACATVQEGITAASKLTNSAITLQVAPPANAAQGGYYFEDVTIDGFPASDSLTVQGIGNPTIRGIGGTTVTVGVNPGSHVLLQGLTITGGNAFGDSGGGIGVFAPGVVINGDTITGNGGVGSGGGIYNDSA